MAVCKSTVHAALGDPSAGPPGGGGGSAANLLSWFKRLAPGQNQPGSHNDGTGCGQTEGGALTSGGGHHSLPTPPPPLPLPPHPRGGPSSVTSPPPPTSAELWAALQVLQVTALLSSAYHLISPHTAYNPRCTSSSLCLFRQCVAALISSCSVL